MMNKNIIKGALFIIAMILCINISAKSKVITSKGDFTSRFLIVVDNDTYKAAKREITDYKKVLESEGLGVNILIGEWSNPDVLRDEIKAIYEKKPVMEGAVFVGNIPVVRVQNFQHSTTAFKMDEVKFPIEESSVTSDRFYDDLDLEFELIRQDEKNPLIYYYKLKESSPQVIMSDFYSARMLPPSDMGTDPVTLLKRYLVKVVAAHKEINPLDRLVIFNGHGYNSDCLTAWQNEQFAIKEQIPLAFKSSKGNGFYNFRQDPFMKFRLFEKMQQSGTDLFIFHEHGAFDTQYINGDFPAQNILENSGPLNVMSISLRNTYRRYKGERAEKFKADVIKEYGFTEEFFKKERLDSLRVSDSLFAASINIVLQDLPKIKMQPKISIFDACYNGSFHQPGYIAGYHVFGNGNTIVAQGNTVNVLQDKWSLELVGMLAEGARAGFWQKEFQYLESHMIGDPTYHFYSEGAKELNHRLAQYPGEPAKWRDYLNSDNVNRQAIAIKQISKADDKNLSAELLKIFKESNHYTVRMEALKRIIEIRDDNAIEAVRLGLDDPYELIRRVAARYAAYYGDDIFIAPLVHTILFSNESQRVQYTAQSSLPMFDAAKVAKEIERQVNASNITDKAGATESLGRYFIRQEASQDKALKSIQNKQEKFDTRMSAVRGLRNYNNHKQVSSLLEVLKDNSDDDKIRVALAEALGWFNLSIHRDAIYKALETVNRDESSSEQLKSETLQSLKRLK